MGEEIGQLFLKEFIKAVIKTIDVPKEIQRETPIKKMSMQMVDIKRLKKDKQGFTDFTKDIMQTEVIGQQFVKSKPLIQDINPSPIPLPVQPFIQVPTKQNMVMQKRVPIQIHKIERQPTIQRPTQNINRPPNRINAKNEQFQKSVMDDTSKVTSFNIEKIRPLLYDASIYSIECTGPDKPIIVNRSGNMETTALMLTQNDITQIIEEVSAKTKIPLIGGVFKAAFGAFIITAVVSDFVGTRFLIQRKPQAKGNPYFPQGTTRTPSI